MDTHSEDTRVQRAYETGPPLPAERPRGITPGMRETFLERLAAGFSVTAAAAPTGRNRRRFYALREEDAEFARAWDDAWEAGQDWIEDEIRKAATEGWDEETYEKGELVRVVRRRDPRLLARLERKRQPEAVGTGPVSIAIVTAFPGARREVGAGEVIELSSAEVLEIEEEAGS